MNWARAYFVVGDHGLVDRHAAAGVLAHEVLVVRGDLATGLDAHHVHGNAVQDAHVGRTLLHVLDVHRHALGVDDLVVLAALQAVVQQPRLDDDELGVRLDAADGEALEVLGLLEHDVGVFGNEARAALRHDTAGHVQVLLAFRNAVEREVHGDDHVHLVGRHGGIGSAHVLDDREVHTAFLVEVAFLIGVDDGNRVGVALGHGKANGVVVASHLRQVERAVVHAVRPHQARVGGVRTRVRGRRGVRRGLRRAAGKPEAERGRRERERASLNERAAAEADLLHGFPFPLGDTQQSVPIIEQHSQYLRYLFDCIYYLLAYNK